MSDDLYAVPHPTLRCLPVACGNNDPNLTRSRFLSVSRSVSTLLSLTRLLALAPSLARSLPLGTRNRTDSSPPPMPSLTRTTRTAASAQIRSRHAATPAALSKTSRARHRSVSRETSPP